MKGLIQLILRGDLDVSPSDILALQQMPLSYIWAWLDGARHRRDEERRFRGQLLSDILRISGYVIDPEQIYPTRRENLDEKLAELAKKW